MHDVPCIFMKMRGNQLIFKQGISLKGYNNTIDNKEIYIYKHYKYMKCLNNEHLESSRSDFQNLPSKGWHVQQSWFFQIILLIQLHPFLRRFHWLDGFLRFPSFTRATFDRFSTQVTPIESKPSFLDFQLGLIPFLSSFIFHLFFIFSFFFFSFSLITPLKHSISSPHPHWLDLIIHYHPFWSRSMPL